MECKCCERYILSQCVGIEGIKDCGSFLENIYNIEIDKEVSGLEEMYREANKLYAKDENFRNESHEALKDLQTNKEKSQYYSLWRIITIIQTSNLLDMYHKMNVNLTLKDFKGESFYSGIPNITADEVKMVEFLLNLFKKG